MRREVSFCHDEQQLGAAATWFRSDEPRKVLVLAGAVGSGRRYLLDHIAAQASVEGRPTRVLPLSLDGFEPAGAGVAGFVQFRVLLRPLRNEAVTEQLQQLLTRIGQHDPSAGSHGAWALAFALWFELSDDAAEAVLNELSTGTEPPTPERCLASSLRDATAQGPCILHVLADSTLSDPSVHWLLSTALAQPQVSLAFSCAPGLANEALLGPRASAAPCSLRRLELPQWTQEQALARLRQLQNPERAEPVTLDAEQLARVAAAAQGSVGRLGRALAEQVSAAKDTTPSARLEAWFATLGDDASKLRRVLCWAAACGEVVPILPLLAASSVSQADAERYIDKLDEELCGEGATLPIFDDIAYRHPGFPGLAVYRFRDRALRCALLDQPDAAAQLAAERELLQFLGARMAVATRSIAQLFVNLTERVQFDLSAGPRQRLRLWVGQAEQASLSNLLRTEIAGGRLPAEAILRSALQDQSLPAHPRLALLEASVGDEAQLPHERRVMVAGARTELLCATGRLTEGLASAEHGLNVLASGQPEPPGVRGLLLFLRANCQRQLGQLAEALGSFKLAAEEAAKPRPDGSIDLHNRGVCLAEAGHCHAERGEWANAAALLREALGVLRAGPADARVGDEQIAQLEHNLGVCEAKLQAAAASSA